MKLPFFIQLGLIRGERGENLHFYANCVLQTELLLLTQCACALYKVQPELTFAIFSIARTLARMQMNKFD